MNNPITVKIKSNIDITDEQKNELREKLVYAFIEQLRKSGMYKVTEEKDGYAWILRADLILPKKHEAEPDNGWISVKDRLPEFGKKAGEYALDEFEYKGLTIRQWADKITSGEYQPVKPAHWSINPDGYYPQCSNCGYEPPRELIKRNGDALIFPRYCSECGADTKREVR